jgi:hypothetical protein
MKLGAFQETIAELFLFLKVRVQFQKKKKELLLYICHKLFTSLVPHGICLIR